MSLVIFRKELMMPGLNIFARVGALAFTVGVVVSVWAGLGRQAGSGLSANLRACGLRTAFTEA